MYYNLLIKLNTLLSILTSFYFVAFLFLFFFLKNKKETANNIIYLLSFSMIINYIIKFTLKIPLPQIVPLGMESSEWIKVQSQNYSMPSGHANHIFTILFTLFFELKNSLKKLQDKIIFIFFTICIFIKAFLIYKIGFHFFSDVIAAFFIAFIQVALYYEYIKQKENRLFIFFLINLTLCILCMQGILVKKDFGFAYRFVIILGVNLNLLKNLIGKIFNKN